VSPERRSKSYVLAVAKNQFFTFFVDCPCHALVAPFYLFFIFVFRCFFNAENIFLEKVRFGASKRSGRLGRVSKLVIGLMFIENGGLRVELWPFPFLLF